MQTASKAAGCSTGFQLPESCHAFRACKRCGSIVRNETYWASASSLLRCKLGTLHLRYRARLTESFFFSQSCVTETTDDFQNLAASWEHATACTLVGIQSVHELNLFVVVFTLACRRIDLATTLLLATWLTFFTDCSQTASMTAFSLRRFFIRRSI